MTIEDYKKNIERLKEIEAIVKNPESSLDKIDALLAETKALAEQCRNYTRELRGKVDTLE